MGIIKEIQSDLDNAALRVVSDYRSRLSAEALKLCGNPTDSEDLVMRTFDAVFRARDTYDSKKGDFYPWIVGVMHRVWAKTDRRIVDRATQPVDPLILNDLAGASNKTMEDILRNSDHDALRVAINHLEPEYRKLIGLYYFDDLSLKEIAAFLKTSPSSISRKLEVARKILMAKLSVQLGKKKPLAVLLGVLLGAGALFGAWQAGVSIVESMSESGRAVSMKPPTIEDNQPTLTATDPTAPVMTYPTFSSETTTSTEPVSTKQKESAMTTIKKTLLAAVSAVSLMSAGSADAYQDLKTYLMPSGATATDTDNGFKYEYTANDTTYYVEVFTSSGSWTVPDNVYLMDYLVVGGGGAGGSAAGGGGGAGGMLSSTEPVLVSPKMILNASVGKGGTGVAKASGNPGENSVLTIPTLASPITAYGGGYGGYQAPGGAGGSGGGGGVAGKAGGATRDSAQGFEGGSAGSNYSGCGGGAGQKGGTGEPGKVGRACSITGKDVVFAGGGGCASSTKNANYLNTWGSGGSGIGGNGGASSGTVVGAAGMDGTGSGGGGNGNSTDAGGKGGDGIIIIRYTITETSVYPITINAAQNGTISGAVSGQEIPAGLAITLEAVPDDGYELVNWTVNGVDVGSENPLVLAMNAAKTVSATIRMIQWASQELKTYLMPEGAANVQDTLNRGFSYAYLDGDVKYVVEVFAKTGLTTWPVPDDVTAIDYLVVGGGGAGGSTYSSLSTSSAGGGGGAGGMLASSEPITVAAGSEISILVGAGGIGVAGKSGKPGENSVLTIPALSSPITALGGGYGGQNNTAGGSGGSGGGGGAQKYQAGGAAGTTRDSAQGCDGGKGGGTYGGCGGGAGAAGGSDGTAGAVGRSCAITGKEVIFAGGGGCGGNAARDFSKWGTGGSGIGGRGGSSTAGETLGAAGMDGTGSGGGGNGNSSDAGGKGGDGIVIIRYIAPLKDNVTVAHAGEVAYGATLLNPTYGDYAIGGYSTYTAPTFVETETAGVRAYCLGWQLLDKYDFPSGKLNPSTTATPEYTDGGYTVQWNWELRYMVAAKPTGSGSISGAGDYVEGATVTLVATADEGSHFAGWEGVPAGATTIEETTLVFTMGTAQVNITAKFDEDIEKGVTVASEGGNYGTPSPAYGTYAGNADGNEHTYSMAETVIGEGGEKIYLAGWKLQDGEGELVRDSKQEGESIDSVTLTCGTDEAFTLVWKWETRYTLTTVANRVEGGTVTGAGDYAAGATVTLMANVTGGYKLTGWEGAPEGATSVENTLTFTMPAVPTTVTANFEMMPWGITVVSGVTTNDYREKCVPNTAYQFQSPLYAEIKEGDSRKRCLGYTLTPMCEGGEESDLKVAELEGETLTATVTYAEPVRLTWKWADDYYFTLAQDGEGTVTGPDEGWYERGTPFELTATPASGYNFLCWMGSVSGKEATISGTIAKPTNVKALFSPVQQVKSDWEAIEGKPAMSRMVKSLGKTYCVVKFTGSTAFDIPKKVTSIDCLVVGGGGSGGAKSGGGGGAGGFIYQTGLAVTPEDQLTVTVGAGAATGGSSNHGNDGEPTTLGLSGQKITAQGGGYGGYDNGNPNRGASGGGAPGNAVSTTYLEKMGGASTAVAPEQGNPGGSRPITATSGKKCGAGGGGAGGEGADVGDGKGGEGLPSAITGETVWYANGGAGGASNYSPGDGAANTGNGGGGGSGNAAGYAGGSGVVIIRYALPPKGMVMLIY